MFHDEAGLDKLRIVGEAQRQLEARTLQPTQVESCLAH